MDLLLIYILIFTTWNKPQNIGATIKLYFYIFFKFDFFFIWLFLIIIYYLTKVSTPLKFQQHILYNFSRDNTAQIKLGYILEQSMCCLYKSTHLLSSKYNYKKWVHPKWTCQNCPKYQYFVEALFLSSTALMLLSMAFTKAAQVVVGILFHSSIMTSRSCLMLDTWCFSTFCLRMPHMCSIGFRSGDILGHSITFTFSSKAVVILVVCLEWLCWKIM